MELMEFLYRVIDVVGCLSVWLGLEEGCREQRMVV